MHLKIVQKSSTIDVYFLNESSCLFFFNVNVRSIVFLEMVTYSEDGGEVCPVSWPPPVQSAWNDATRLQLERLLPF